MPLGLELLREVRRQGLAVRIAVMTGTAEERLRRELPDLRPEGVFDKPLDPVAVEQWLSAAA